MIFCFFYSLIRRRIIISIKMTIIMNFFKIFISEIGIFRLEIKYLRRLFLRILAFGDFTRLIFLTKRKIIHRVILGGENE
jgi:hypothetical protein